MERPRGKAPKPGRGLCILDEKRIKDSLKKLVENRKKQIKMSTDILVREKRRERPKLEDQLYDAAIRYAKREGSRNEEFRQVLVDDALERIGRQDKKDAGLTKLKVGLLELEASYRRHLRQQYLHVGKKRYRFRVKYDQSLDCTSYFIDRYQEEITRQCKQVAEARTFGIKAGNQYIESISIVIKDGIKMTKEINLKEKENQILIGLMREMELDEKTILSNALNFYFDNYLDKKVRERMGEIEDIALSINEGRFKDMNPVEKVIEAMKIVGKHKAEAGPLERIYGLIMSEVA